jgi:hypothetical protein
MYVQVDKCPDLKSHPLNYLSSFTKIKENYEIVVPEERLYVLFLMRQSVDICLLQQK